MLTRRQAVRLLGSMPAAVLAATAHKGSTPMMASVSASAIDDLIPSLAPGAPMSPERRALVEAFKERSAGLEDRFEAMTHKGDWAMPYRLFRPATTAKAPLVVFLHGSGGLGNDNRKQMGLGNIFGTRIWALPENQKTFPCYVLAPQTDRGWVRYDPAQWARGKAEIVPGLGEGARTALEVIDAVRREFAIDDQRVYVTGQSMGGAGAWNVMAHRPRLFAAAVICCGSISADDGAGSIDVPLWNFHGDSDKTVPVSVSRERMAARRKAGGRPFYTEYAGVDHDVWEWAYTEPAVVTWLFSQR